MSPDMNVFGLWIYGFIVAWILLIIINATFQLVLKEKILGWLLFHANSKPFPGFYEIKSEILKKHGKFCSYEFQHFDAKECYSCNGSGRYYDYEEEYQYDTCHKCGGTGVYLPEKWVCLAKYQIGIYFFHIPKGSCVGEIDIPATIKIIQGKIFHAPKKHDVLANFLIFFFWKHEFPETMFGKFWNYHPQNTVELLSNAAAIIRRPYKIINQIIDDKSMPF